MKKLIFLITIIGSLLLSSCAASHEATSNQNQNQTSVVLSKNNYRVVGYVKGESKQTYVLGIGGLSKRSLAQSAMSEMYNNADIKDKPRAIINSNIQYKNQFYFFWSKSKVIVTGTIIEFVD